MSSNNDYLSEYANKKVLITGGLGFIGSSIARKLVSLGAKVTIIDNLDTLYGGNLFNIEDVKDKIEIVSGNTSDQNLIERLLLDKDVIFDLAAQVSHSDSSQMPFEDLEMNCKSHLILLEACRQKNPKAKIVFSSSRLTLGKILENPITEEHPTNPLSLYGIHKLTTEKYFVLYNKIHGIPTTVLRLTNPYGERQQIKHSKYSMPGWFMRLAMEDKTINIFGDGEQLRDYIHINDIVDAFLLVGIKKETDGEIYNCGIGQSVTFKKMVDLVTKIVGSGKVKHVPWPENYEKEETGHCEVDISKLKRATIWQPIISIEEGLERMWQYYKIHKDKYISE